MQQIQSGLLGNVYMSRGLCYKWRDTIGHARVESVPAGVHYDLWTGPAPLKPFTKNRNQGVRGWRRARCWVAVRSLATGEHAARWRKETRCSAGQTVHDRQPVLRVQGLSGHIGLRFV